MTDAKQWLIPGGAGAAGALLAGLYWDAAHSVNASCEAHACWFPFSVGFWLIGGCLFPGVTWLLMLLAGLRGGARALLLAAIGSAVFGLEVGAYVSVTYGTPRPPYVLLGVFGAVAFGAAVALISGRTTRLLAGALVVLLVAGAVVGQINSPRRDRLHRFTALTSINQLPDPARWQVTSAQAYLRYGVVQLSLEPVGGGPAITALELPRPADWDPPSRCGPGLTTLEFKIAFRTSQETRNVPCTAYPGGGWQRVYSATAAELVDLRGGTLVIVSEVSAVQPVPTATLREVLTSFRPATAVQMTDLAAS